MATTTTPAAGTTAKAKERRTWTARYGVAGKDAFEVRLERRRDGSWRTSGRHIAGSGKARKTARGATETHSNEKDARAAFERL